VENNRKVLIILVKDPAPGKVKTRLAHSLGPERAASVYRKMAEGIWRTTAGAGYRRWLVFAPAGADDRIKRWLPGADLYVQQVEGDLGNRLSEAFRAAFEAGAEAAIAVGTDVPELSSARIEHAFGQLESYPAVLGPSPDGGYWSIGLKRHCPEAFQEIAWSGPDTFRQTFEALSRCGLAPLCLESLRDVDNLEDLCAFPYLLDGAGEES
jgi:uncharacterized protein